MPTDAADQAVDIATSLYYMGNGAYLSNPNASVANLEVNPGVVPAGDPTHLHGVGADGNGVPPTIVPRAQQLLPDGSDAVQRHPHGHGARLDGQGS